jgi:poly(3-hydroxybutyrate) depolymerase
MKKRIGKRLAWLLSMCMMALLLPMTALATSKDDFKPGSAVSIDSVRVPAHDFTSANRLPMTGYFEKSLTVNNFPRTAKIYIPSGAPIRPYFTVISVPDGVVTEEFLLKSGWKALADQKNEGLFVLEPGKNGWGKANEELAYVTDAMNFFYNPVDAKTTDTSNNKYFSIFGENYLVGYGNGAPALEAWAAANPLRVISQAYVDSKGLTSDYFKQFYTKEFGGKNGAYNEIIFPAGFEKITYDEVVLPTWYINPDNSTISDSLNYWKNANDCVTTPVKDKKLGYVYKQNNPSSRWMTSYSGSISKVAITYKKANSWNNKNFTGQIYNFLAYYSRYENAVAYANQLVVRADYDKLGVEIKTMIVNGQPREYMVYVPDSAKKLWGDKAPVMFVFPGDSQTDRVFLDATQWWKVADEKGFVFAIICEQYNKSSVAVSHKDKDLFYQALREEILKNYKVDATRVYATGQSAGSMISQSFAVGKPEYFAAVASTSGPAAPDSTGILTMMEGTKFAASNKMIPSYLIYGTGDLSMLKGDLWDSETNSLDDWAKYRLNANGFTLSSDDEAKGVISGWFGRFKTWTWSKNIGKENVELVKLSRNIYRSHNCTFEEMPMLWDFLEHYSFEKDKDNNIVRYYSPSGFKVAGDKVKIN